MPMVVHAAVALFASILFASVALLLVMADHELKPLSTSLLAAPHSMTELKSILMKTIITAVDILMTPWGKAQAVIFAICTSLNLYWHISQVSHSRLGSRLDVLKCGATLHIPVITLPYYTAWMSPTPHTSTHSPTPLLAPSYLSPVAPLLHRLDELPEERVLRRSCMGVPLPCRPYVHS